MNILNTSAEMLNAFDSECFDIERWKAYINRSVPGAGELCLNDLREMLNTGLSWQNDILPVLNSVVRDPVRREKAISSFCHITEHLDRKIIERFHRTVDVDIILCLGLCNGAGWVTSVNGKRTVLLGIEKIIELDWCNPDAMAGLIIHELGHVYQDQYGVLHRKLESASDQFLWQLFTEGIAMVFEQEIVGDLNYFHQDKHGWKQWCDEHAALIRQSFGNDMKSMTRENQRYFGDWVSFEGYGDTGYYLGARFVRFLLEYDTFDHIILYSIQEVENGFDRFRIQPSIC